MTFNIQRLYDLKTYQRPSRCPHLLEGRGKISLFNSEVDNVFATQLKM